LGGDLGEDESGAVEVSLGALGATAETAAALIARLRDSLELPPRDAALTPDEISGLEGTLADLRSEHRAYLGRRETAALEAAARAAPADSTSTPTAASGDNSTPDADGDEHESAAHTAAASEADGPDS